MLSFLVQEGVLTVGTISGIFTAAMLNSFRINVLEPGIETMLPSSKLDTEEHFAGSLENIMLLPTKPQEPVTPAERKRVKWQTFLRDLITWMFLMFCLYLFWKTFLVKFKNV